jgi:GDP-L-fucose synthase
LEPTNEWYAIAKISGIKLIEALRKQYSRDYISIMPTNLYGPMDNFDLNSSHVLPAMIRKFHEAKLNKNSTVELWGSGKPMREFLHVNDLGKAVLFVLENKLNFGLYNVGTGNDLKIKELAHIVQKIINHTGKIKWNLSKPDGTPRKLMNIERLKNEGWTHKIDLLGGIEKTYSWFLENNSIIKKISL